MSYQWEEPEPYGCIYCGVHDLLYEWENDGPMCMDCIEGAKADCEEDDDEYGVEEDDDEDEDG